MMRSLSLCLIWMLACPVIAVGSDGAPPPDGVEEFAQFLQVQVTNKTFLKVENELRRRLAQDEDGALVYRLLGDPNLRRLLFYNIDAAPDQYVDLILAEELTDDMVWDLWRTGMMYSSALAIACTIVERFEPQDWVNADTLSMALEDKKDRLAISAILRNLADELATADDLEAQELRDVARDQILLIVATPAKKPPPETYPSVEPKWKRRITY